MVDPTQQPQADFQRDGFVALRDFLSASELVELTRELERFIEHVVPAMPPEHVFCEDRNDLSTLKQLQQMGSHDPWFEQLFQEGRFRSVAERLTGGPVVPKNMQYFNKPPRVGQPTPPHQDGYYFMLDPCEAVTLWLALDDVDETNGCVRYVRGSHQDGLREHTRTKTLGFSQGIVDFPTEQDLQNEVALPAQPGDLLAHQALTIHWADGNTSNHRSRRALGFIYYGANARQDEDAHAAYQRKLTQDLKAAQKI